MVSTLSGDNRFALRLELNKLINNFINKYGDIALERINASEVQFNNLIEAVQAMPFLVEKRMVVIENPSGNKELADKIKQIMDGINDQTDVIFYEPKFDKRSSLYKTLKKLTDFKEFNELDENSLSRWLVDKAREDSGQISLNDARYLVQRVGQNQLKLSNELDKLLSYDSHVTKQSIDLLTESNPQSTVFDMLDSLFRGNKKRAIEIYNQQRKQKVDPQKILGLLNWQLHVLALVKAAAGKTNDVIAKEAKLNPYVVSKSANLARNISFSEIKTLINKSLKLDMTIKTKTIDVDDAVVNLLITI